MAEVARSQEGVRGVHTTKEGAQDNAPAGRDLLWSRRRGGKREGVPETANTPFEKARRLFRPAIGVCQVRAAPAGFGGGSENRSDAPLNGRMVSDAGAHAR